VRDGTPSAPQAHQYTATASQVGLFFLFVGQALLNVMGMSVVL
jgi:hypothetical protein